MLNLRILLGFFLGAVLVLSAFGAQLPQLETFEERISRLVKEMDHQGEFAVRERATKELAEQPAEDVIPILEDLVTKHPKTEVRNRARIVLNRISPVLPWEELVDMLALNMVQSSNVRGLVEAVKTVHSLLRAAPKHIRFQLVDEVKQLAGALGVREENIHWLSEAAGSPGREITKELDDPFMASKVAYAALHFVQNGQPMTLVVGIDGRFCVRYGHSLVSMHYAEMDLLDSLAGKTAPIAPSQLAPYTRFPNGKYMKDLRFPRKDFEIVQFSPVAITDVMFPCLKARIAGEDRYASNLNLPLEQYVEEFERLNELPAGTLKGLLPGSQRPISPTLDGSFVYYQN